MRDYFKATGENEELNSRSIQMIDDQGYTDDIEFDQIYDDVAKQFKEDFTDDAEDGIGNLALLDSSTNRGYKNAGFPIKRKKILRSDQEGTFVPLCTRNAFLKCYSSSLEHMFRWSSDDQSDYRDAIADTLCRFFKDKGNSDATSGA